jgi:hypothetical protein
MRFIFSYLCGKDFAPIRLSLFFFNPCNLHPVIRFTTFCPSGLALLKLAFLFHFSGISTVLTAQCTLVCNQGIQVSLNPAGQALITTQLIAPNAPSSCPGPLELTLLNNVGQTIPNPLTCANIGQAITARVRHIASGNFCTGDLTVQDALGPVLSCPDKFIFCNENPEPSEVGGPTATDNCSPSNALSLQYFDNQTELGCGVVQNGFPVLKRIDRNWIVTDEHNNSSTCVQKVWLRHIRPTDVTYPPNLNNITAPALACGSDPNDLSLTGAPSVAGIPLDNSIDCEIGVAHTDQIINNCPPASYTVLRTWTIIDFCTSGISTRIQIIKVEDKIAPVITPPADISIGTDGFTCGGSLTLPQASATDNCSAFNILPSWTYGSGYGPFTNIPLGTHTITYTATDACNNTSSVTMRVSVEDTTPPQAICSSSLQLGLTAGGSALLNAASLGPNSTDNCGPVVLTAKRDEGAFEPQVLFSCADIGQPVLVTLQVTDAVGLENFCETEIIVRDFLKPNIQCPPALTLHCLQDYNDLVLTGTATASDNCSLQSIEFVDITNLNACNIGSISRIWKATDTENNLKSCTQTISLNAINTTTVTFPANYLLNGCPGSDALLPDATGWPVLGGQACSQLSMDFTDQLFTGTPPFCARILRSWKVVDHCIYNPNGGNAGIWEHTQIIDVIDNTAPYLETPADITLIADPLDCTANLLLDDVFTSDCSVVSVSNDSPFAQTSGPNASGVYPVGLHIVHFTASDACGNSSSKNFRITVKDETPPTAVCQTGIALILPVSGFVVPDPSSFGIGSSDACSPVNSLTYSISPDTFTCQTIGFQPLTLSVQDSSGNSAVCNTFVLIKDNDHVCGGGGVTLDGSIRTPTGLPLHNVPVIMTLGGISETLDCDTTGHFVFEDVPMGDTCTIRPWNNANWLNGVTTYDLLLISKHILGIEPLNSPLKMIAADANKSNSITTFDIVQLRKVLLGILDSVPGNTSWCFIDSNFVFANPFNPFSAPFPESITYNGLNGNQLGNNFSALKIGDVNNSTDPANARSPQDTLFLQLDNLTWKADDNIALPIHIPDWGSLSGFQFELEFDAEKVLVESIDFPNPALLNEKNAALRDGKWLSLSWDNALGGGEAAVPACVLHLHGLAASDIHTAVKLYRKRLSPEAYTLGEEAIHALAFAGSAAATEAFPGSLQLFPNPSSGAFQIANPLKNEAEHLRVSDQMGRVVWAQTGGFSDLISISLQGLLPGVYGVELMGGSTVMRGRVVLK